MKVIHVGPVAVGLYGVVLVADFLVQLTCALANRVSVNRIVAARRALVSETIFADKPLTPVSTPPLMHPEASISIAIVGYREDVEAWRLCIRSIQQQTMRPRQVIVVVNGNEAQDLKMPNVFSDEYAGQNTALIHLPFLLSAFTSRSSGSLCNGKPFKHPDYSTESVDG
ncbi:hypothetical protein OC846_006444 [Tilletia horrida]|uniref:Uncharacterized protein n=1 Tax=Tilletia horrida TaxID=155126 RepID=A0AAN6GLM9_9BASI|nr:hypothetical protein OC846_006444 [Tilletia horrida]KAK0559785.1 hypothetical protein OC861_006533 [Tilletia horrida]